MRRHRGTRVRRIPGVADAAEGRNVLAGQLVERVGLCLAVNQVDGSVACFDKRQSRGRAPDPAADQLALDGPSRSARERTTAEMRRSERIGSLMSPRGKSFPSPKGSRASSMTRSRSRASRRCWNPS